MEVYYSSGNKIVDAVGKMNLTGNVIPEAWYLTITTVTKNNKRKTCPLAILLLADIVYWYRPVEHRDESTQSVTYRKKFHDQDFLQRNYEQISKKFGISKKQARDALKVLEDLRVVKRHLRNEITPSGIKLSNVMYLELNPDMLKELTYPNGTPNNDPSDKFVTTPLQKGNDLIPTSSSYPDKKMGTYTKTTTETIPETSRTTGVLSSDIDISTGSVVVTAKEVFAELNLPDKDIESILKAAGNDISKCEIAMQVYAQQTKPIRNKAGWLITAIKDGYRPLTKIATTRANPTAKANLFLQFEQNEYTDEELDAIEADLLALSG